MTTKTLEQAITAIAGLWDVADFPTDPNTHEYLRGQIETIVDLFPLPEEHQEDAAKPYVYNLIRAELGLDVPIYISEEMYGTWEHIVNFHKGAQTFESAYTLGQLELFIAEARGFFSEDITANDIPALIERLKKDVEN